MENINKALAQLEESLQKIDSARIQVEKVTESGSELSKSTIKLVEDVKALTDIIKNETTKIIIEFEKKLKSLDNDFRIANEDFSKKITEVANISTNVILNVKEQSINNINEVTSVSVSTIERQEKLIHEAIGNILKYSQTIQDLVNEISEMELPESLKSIENRVSQLQNSIENVQRELGEQIKNLAKYISDMELPERLILLEKKIYELQYIIENVQKNLSNLIFDLSQQVSEMKLPERLSFLENKVSDLQSSMEAIQKQISEQEQTILNSIQSHFDDLNIKLLRNTKSTNTINTISIITLIAVLSSIAISLLK